MNRTEMERLTAGAPSISERIRILHDAGVEKADIAAFLERRYQHVYNVIKDYEARKPKARSAVTPASSEILSLKLGRDGTVRLPAEWIAAEGLQPGDLLIGRTEARGLLIMSRSAATEAVRDLARKHMPGEAALLDALLGGKLEER